MRLIRINRYTALIYTVYILNDIYHANIPVFSLPYTIWSTMVFDASMKPKCLRCINVPSWSFAGRVNVSPSDVISWRQSYSWTRSTHKRDVPLKRCVRPKSGFVWSSFSSRIRSEQLSGNAGHYPSSHRLTNTALLQHASQTRTI